MSLVKCPDCGKEISDVAATCIGCGRPMPMLTATPQSTEKPKSTVPASSLGIKWVKFWSYFYLQVTIISVLAPWAGSYIEPYRRQYGTVPGWVTNVPILIVLVSLVLSWGLHARKAWAWNLNWIPVLMPVLTPLFVAPLVNPSMGMPGRVLGFLAVVAVWVLPNIAYWGKRRELFD